MILSPEYVAGFFDGEGCVNFTVRGRYRQVVLRVMIVNTDPSILEFLKVKYGGRIPKPRVFQSSWKAFRQLVLVGSEAARLLEEIRPFAVVKRPQIELALEFWRFQHLPFHERCDVVQLGPGHTPGVRPNKISRKPETVAKELEFKARMHTLNRKGA